MSYGTILSPDQRNRIDALLKGFTFAYENNKGAKEAIEQSGLTEKVFRQTLKELKSINYEAYKTVSSNLNMEDIGDMF